MAAFQSLEIWCLIFRYLMGKCFDLSCLSFIGLVMYLQYATDCCCILTIIMVLKIDIFCLFFFKLIFNNLSKPVWNFYLILCVRREECLLPDYFVLFSKSFIIYKQKNNSWNSHEKRLNSNSPSKHVFILWLQRIKLHFTYWSSGAFSWQTKHAHFKP